MGGALRKSKNGEGDPQPDRMEVKNAQHLNRDEVKEELTTTDVRKGENLTKEEHLKLRGKIMVKNKAKTKNQTSKAIPVQDHEGPISPRYQHKFPLAERKKCHSKAY